MEQSISKTASLVGVANAVQEGQLMTQRRGHGFPRHFSPCGAKAILLSSLNCKLAVNC